MSVLDVCRLIQADAASDAEKLDSTPFTPAGIGAALGEVLAQIAALAAICEEQQKQINSLIEVHGT